MLIIAVAGIWSCKETPPLSAEQVETGGYSVKIEIPAGDLVQQDYLPALGNIANIRHGNEEHAEVLILSRRKSIGMEQNIWPVALLKFKRHGKESKVIIAVPFDKSERIILISSFAELAVQHGHVKRIIEEWYGGRGGISKVENLLWENENQALKFLLELVNSHDL